MTFAVVDPESIWSPIVVADVEVGGEITIHITERCRKSPIERRLSQGLAGFVEKTTGRPRVGLKMPLAVVQEELIRLSAFLQFSIHESEPIGIGAAHDRTPADHGYADPSAV